MQLGKSVRSNDAGDGPERSRNRQWWIPRFRSKVYGDFRGHATQFRCCECMLPDHNDNSKGTFMRTTTTKDSMKDSRHAGAACGCGADEWNVAKTLEKAEYDRRKALVKQFRRNGKGKRITYDEIMTNTLVQQNQVAQMVQMTVPTKQCKREREHDNPIGNSNMNKKHRIAELPVALPVTSASTNCMHVPVIPIAPVMPVMPVVSATPMSMLMPVATSVVTPPPLSLPQLLEQKEQIQRQITLVMQQQKQQQKPQKITKITTDEDDCELDLDSLVGGLVVVDTMADVNTTTDANTNPNTVDLDANIDLLAFLEQAPASCKVSVGCEGQHQQQQSMDLQLPGQYDGEYDGDPSDNDLTIDGGFNVSSPDSVSSMSTNTSDISDCDGLSPRSESGRNQGDSISLPSSQDFAPLPLSKQQPHSKNINNDDIDGLFEQATLTDGHNEDSWIDSLLGHPDLSEMRDLVL